MRRVLPRSVVTRIFFSCFSLYNNYFLNVTRTHHIRENVVSQVVRLDSLVGLSVVLLNDVHLGFPNGTTVSLGFGIVGLVVASLCNSQLQLIHCVPHFNIEIQELSTDQEEVPLQGPRCRVCLRGDGAEHHESSDQSELHVDRYGYNPMIVVYRTVLYSRELRRISVRKK